ncbi:Sialidase [Bisporella sp. PMI_857]|nr:Sialidase [Bisporella sp. PMI_857]
MGEIFLGTISRSIKTACVSPPPVPAPFSDFNNNVVFVPGSDYTSWRTIYARPLQLPDNSLLMTWENYPPEPPKAYFPIYRSTDGGATWSEYSRVQDLVNGWGNRYQPFLYLLEQPFAGFPKNTILCAGASVPADLSKAYIDLYASQDNGLSWQFVSHIAYGSGPETVPNGNKAIWEPFLMIYGSQMICYFSDQRDPLHGQKLTHVTSTDLKTWSTQVDDVAYSTYGDRPGMTTVAHIKSTKKYIMTYEYCGSANCQAYYKVSTSPLNFLSATGYPVASNDSSHTVPHGSPYVIWTENPARNDGSGLIIMNGNSVEGVFVNVDSAPVDGWKLVNVGQWSAYSRALKIINVQGKKKLLLANGGNMVSNTECNYVVCGVVEIPT